MSVTQRLRAVAEAGSDPDNLAARAALLEGQGLAIEGQLNEALLAVDAARDAFVAASEPWLALRTDLGRMHILNELGQTTAAVHVGTELLRVADGLEAADESPGPLPFAVDWLRASCLTNLGVCHTFAGDYVAAAAATAAAEQHLLALRRQDEIAILRQNQAELLLAEGHAHRARDMFAHAVRGFAETDQLRLHTAEAYLALNLYDEAALIYDQVTALVELSGQAHYHAVALAGRGAALAALQRWDEASELLQRAAERHDRVGNVPLATASRVELAAVLAHRGDRDAAVDLLRRLRGDTGDDRYRVARVYVLLGLSDVAEPVGASAALVEAADLVHRLGLPPLRFRVDSRLGALRRRQGRLVEARDLLQRAADEADDQRALLPSQLTRTSFLRDKTRTFDELVALHLDLEADSADAAFLASERAKGRALLDLVSTTATPGAPVAEMLDSAVARVLDDEGLGSVWTTAEAIRWASERDADVINLSLGTAADSELLEDAVEDAVAVASVTPTDLRSPFTNFGRWVDVAAPGQGIISSFPRRVYARWDGTSMAAPFVAGQVALLRAQRPAADAETLVARIKRTAVPVGAGLGAGRVDLAASLQRR